MSSELRLAKSGRRRQLELRLNTSPGPAYTPSFSQGSNKTRKRSTLEAERKENILTSASLPDISDLPDMNRRVTPTNPRRGFLGLSNGPVTSSMTSSGHSRRHTISPGLHLDPSSPRTPLSPGLTLTKSAGVTADTLDFFDSRVRPSAPVRSQLEDRLPVKKVSSASMNHMSLDNWLKSLPDPAPTSSKSSSSAEASETVAVADISDCEDGGCIDIDSRLTPLNTNRQSGRAISVERARQIKTLMFGQPGTLFPPGWLGQAFVFNTRPGLTYGFLQERGGPCGVLAAVQAVLVKVLLHGSQTASLRPRTMKALEQGLSLQERSAALAAAMAEILIRCAGDQQEGKEEEEGEYKVVLGGMRKHFSSAGRLRADGLTETVNIHSFSSQPALREFLQQNIGFMTGRGNSAVICLLYSCLLTRGLDTVRADMDSPDSQLMAAHGYCSQEMVNLITTGVAASNVFDDQVVLGSDTEQTVLKGVTEQSEVGLLSLFEHYKSCSVGSNLKSPLYPIWLVCSESHFTTLWASQPGDTSQLVYYDGLAGQESVIHLSLEAGADIPDSEITSSIELCIRTKWPGAAISWNGAEKLL